MVQESRLRLKKLSEGGFTATIVDSRRVLREALILKSCSIFLFHNHPSGSPKPGRQDRLLTQTMKEACRQMEIELVDHVIVAGNNHFSFAEEGYL